MARKWIQGAVRHPGALKAAAKRHGVSTREEAERESHSSDPSIRARGNLGKRFISGKLRKSRKKHRGGRRGGR